MARTDTFTFRIDDGEKRLIEALAERLQRNPSDMVRFVLREAARGIGLGEKGNGVVDEKGGG